MIVIYTPKVTNRMRYVFDFVFKQYLEQDYFIISNPIDFIASAHPKINYSQDTITSSFSIPQETLLLEENIQQQKIFISTIEDMPVCFPTDAHHTLIFDIFSAIFYLISRYEEYLPHEQDEHGRYLSINSILSKPIFNFQPIVEQWLIFLKNKLEQYFPNLVFKKHIFTKTFTFDIDNAFQYQERNWLKHPPNIFKKEVRTVLLNKKNDDYNTFDFIESFVKQTNSQCLFFFLLNDDGKKNSHVNPNSKKLHHLIQQFHHSIIGIHPSYHFSEAKFAQEKTKLEEVINQKIRYSRQHFLKINFPTYFQVLAQHHILHDFSLGYPDVSGCRAGTTQPFYFFNLINNTTTQLILQPFVFMDATYQYYQKIDNDSIAQKVDKLLKSIQKINGNFVTLFHNDLLQEKFIYKKLLFNIDEYKQ